MGLTAWLHQTFFAPARVRLADDLWERALRRPAWTRALDDAAKRRLREFTERFLADKAISAAGGMDLTDERKVLVAMSCCRPVLGLGYEWLDGWHEVIVYPQGFRVPGGGFDERNGVVHERQVAAAGQAWQQGPVILSWAHVREGIDQPTPGHDVVVHEIAHKLDVLDGAMNGAPPLPGRNRTDWAREFQAAFEAVRAELDAGQEPSIDAYAAQSPEEFFAVCSEYWFTAPAVLREAMPRVADLLQQFYGGTPGGTAGDG